MGVALRVAVHGGFISLDLQQRSLETYRTVLNLAAEILFQYEKHPLYPAPEQAESSVSFSHFSKLSLTHTPICA